MISTKLILSALTGLTIAGGFGACTGRVTPSLNGSGGAEEAGGASAEAGATSGMGGTLPDAEDDNASGGTSYAECASLCAQEAKTALYDDPNGTGKLSCYSGTVCNAPCSYDFALGDDELPDAAGTLSAGGERCQRIYRLNAIQCLTSHDWTCTESATGYVSVAPVECQSWLNAHCNY